MQRGATIESTTPFLYLSLCFLVCLGMLLQYCSVFYSKHIIVLKLATVFLSLSTVTKNEPIAEIGQGNGLVPSLWCLIRTILIKMCKQKGHGTTITATISRKEVSFLGFAFVNDADLVTTTNNAYTSDVEMTQKMQSLITDWCGDI